MPLCGVCVCVRTLACKRARSLSLLTLALSLYHIRISPFLKNSHTTHSTNERTKQTAILLDTKGPEIRTGFFRDGASKISLTKGATLVLTSDYAHLGDATKLACSYASMAHSVTPGQAILVADGSLVLTVLSTQPEAGEVSCRVENSCSIGERKNMNLPGVVVDLPTFTEKDVDGAYVRTCTLTLQTIPPTICSRCLFV